MDHLAASRELVETFLRGWTTGDYGVLERVVAPEVEYRDLGGVHDGDGLYEAVSAFSRLFGNSRHEVGLWIVAGGRVGCHFTFQGDHLGRLRLDPPLSELTGRSSIDASGRHVRLEGTLLCEARDGRLVRIILAWDRLALLSQLGVIGAVPAAVVQVPDLQPHAP